MNLNEMTIPQINEVIETEYVMGLELEVDPYEQASSMSHYFSEFHKRTKFFEVKRDYCNANQFLLKNIFNMTNAECEANYKEVQYEKH